LDGLVFVVVGYVVLSKAEIWDLSHLGSEIGLSGM